jgi:hypothetical protein
MVVRTTDIKTEILYGALGNKSIYHSREEFENTKGAISIRISKKNRQHNGQKKKV